MLRITTTNGDELYHADQQPDAMSMTAYDGSQVLVHAGEWGRHKYIRKEGNRYIYPEDLVKNHHSLLGDVVKVGVDVGKKLVDKAKHKIEEVKTANSDLPKGWKRDQNGVVYNEIGAVSIPPSKMNKGVSQVTAGHKKESSVSLKHPISQVTKPIKETKGSENKSRSNKPMTKSSEKSKSTGHHSVDDVDNSRSPRLNNVNVARKYSLKKTKVGSDKTKEMDQIVSAHANSVYDEGERRKGEKYYTSRKTGDNKGVKTPEHLNKVKKDTADRKTAAEKRAKNEKAAINSAHAGAMAYKKKFPDGASTEELEIQKKKTAERKREAEDRARKEESQIRAAHQGDVYGQHKETSNLEEQRRKTEARRIIKQNKSKTDAQINSAHRSRR